MITELFPNGLEIPLFVRLMSLSILVPVLGCTLLAFWRCWENK